MACMTAMSGIGGRNNCISMLFKTVNASLLITDIQLTYHSKQTTYNVQNVDKKTESLYSKFFFKCSRHLI